MEFTKLQRQIVLQNLPQDLREVFFANETTEYLKSIGEARELTDEERAALGEGVGLVLLGIWSVKDFQEEMYDRLSESKKGVNKIVKDIQQQIFQPISAQLTQIDPEQILKKAESASDDKEEDSIPVPPPPGGDSDGGAPTPSYGGTSDPYREPTD